MFWHHVLLVSNERKFGTVQLGGWHPCTISSLYTPKLTFNVVLLCEI